MSIKHWRASERPRERLLTQGAEYLTDAELLAVLWGKGTKERDVLTLARYVLKTLGGLAGCARAEVDALLAIPGIGAGKVAQWRAVLELGQRCFFEQVKETSVLESSAQVKQFLTAKLGQLAHECFAALFLDTHYQILSFQQLSQGNSRQAPVYPGELVKLALRQHAACIILAHNHPSGQLAPSQADKRITRAIKQALQLVDIELLDHIIVGGGRALSFMEHGIVL